MHHAFRVEKRSCFSEGPTLPLTGCSEIIVASLSCLPTIDGSPTARFGPGFHLVRCCQEQRLAQRVLQEQRHLRLQQQSGVNPVPSRRPETWLLANIRSKTSSSAPYVCSLLLQSHSPGLAALKHFICLGCMYKNPPSCGLRA